MLYALSLSQNFDTSATQNTKQMESKGRHIHPAAKRGANYLLNFSIGTYMMPNRHDE